MSADVIDLGGGTWAVNDPDADAALATLLFEPLILARTSPDATPYLPL